MCRQNGLDEEESNGMRNREGGEEKKNEWKKRCCYNWRFCLCINKGLGKLMLYTISFWANRHIWGGNEMDGVWNLQCGAACLMQMKCQHTAKVVNEISNA